VQENLVNRTSAIAAAAVISGIAPIFFNVLPLIVGVFVQSRGYDSQQVGLLASTYLAGHTLATVTLIFFVRRFDWRFGVAGFAVLQATGFAFAAFAEVYGILASFLFFAGLGGGGLFGLSMTCLGDTELPDRSFGLGTFLQTLIPAIIAFVLPFAIIPFWQAKGALLTIAVIALTCIVLLRWFPKHGKRTETKPGETRPIGARAWLSLFGAFVFVVGLAATWTFFERIGDAAGVGPETVGLVISGSLVAGGIGSLVPVVLGDRWGRTWPVFLAGSTLIICILLLWTEPNTARFVIAGLLFFFCWTVSIIYQLGRLVARDESGHIAAVVPALIGVGSTVGPLCGGYLVRDGSFAGLYAFATISTITSMIIVISNRRHVAAPDTATLR